MKDWMKKYEWRENPFNFKIYPDLLVGYQNELQDLQSFVKTGNKFSLVLGETGAGKTNILQWLTSQVHDEREVYYMPKPPKNEDHLLAYLRDDVLNANFLDKWFKNYSLYNIHEDLDEKISSPSIMIIDEGHEASREVLEWIRTAIDHVSNLSVIAAGLPGFEERLEEEVHTLYNRATSIVTLESLNRDESIELVRRRIEKAGGRSIEPFTREALLTIYQESNGFPREILRNCNECVVYAAREELSIIDKNDVKEILGSSSSVKSVVSSRRAQSEEQEDEEDDGTPSHEDLNLTEKQQRILDALEEQGSCTSGEIADSMDIDEYTSRSHAVRSINNILKRLMENDLIDREREGRSYSYFLKD